MTAIPALLAALLLTSPPVPQDGPDPGLASYRAHLAAAEAALRDRDAAAARAWLEAAPAVHRGFEHRLLTARTDECLALWEGHGGAVQGVSWSLDGKRVASASDDGSVRVWDAASGEVVLVLEPQGGTPRSVAWDDAGERLACATAEGALVLWDATSGESIERWEIPPGRTDENRLPSALVWSPDGVRIALSRPGRIEVHRAIDGAFLYEVEGSRPWPMACCARFEEDGALLVAAFWDGLVKTVDAASGEVVGQDEPADERRAFHAFHDLGFDPAGERLGGALFDGSVSVERVGGGDVVRGEVPQKTSCYAAVFSRDGTRFAAGYADGVVRLWDPADGTLLASWLGHRGAVTDLAFDPDGARLVSSSVDGSLRLWDAAGPRGASSVLTAADAVWSAPFSHDGRRLATADSAGKATVWDLASGRAERVFDPFQMEATSVAFTPDGERLVAASNEPFLRVFDLVGDAPPVELRGHAGGIPNVDVGPKGALAASASYDNSVRVWDLDAAECRHVFQLDAYDCAFSPDGRRLATSDGRAVVVLDVQSGGEVARLDAPAHVDDVRALDWSPDGALLASGCQAGSLRVWDVATGAARLARDAAHADTLYGLAFHPGGERFATASYDGTVRLWSPDVPLELCTLRALPEKAYHVSFSPEGERLAVSTIDGAVTIWDARPLREGRAPR